MTSSTTSRREKIARYQRSWYRGHRRIRPSWWLFSSYPHLQARYYSDRLRSNDNIWIRHIPLWQPLQDWNHHHRRSRDRQIQKLDHKKRMTILAIPFPTYNFQHSSHGVLRGQPPWMGSTPAKRGQQAKPISTAEGYLETLSNITITRPLNSKAVGIEILVIMPATFSAFRWAVYHWPGLPLFSLP